MRQLKYAKFNILFYMKYRVFIQIFKIMNAFFKSMNIFSLLKNIPHLLVKAKRKYNSNYSLIKYLLVFINETKYLF